MEVRRTTRHGALTHLLFVMVDVIFTTGSDTWRMSAAPREDASEAFLEARDQSLYIGGLGVRQYLVLLVLCSESIGEHL